MCIGIIPFLLVLIFSPAPAQDDSSRREVPGLIQVPSRYPVAETIDRLDAAVRARGLKVFSRIDFDVDAREAGLSMRPTKLLIFGNPKVGTPLMIDQPTAAIDLPMKALAWEDEDGRVWLSYNDPAYLGERHHLRPEFVEKMKTISVLIEQAAGADGE